ncbi:zinc finger protein 569 isoform X2 [Aedes albopictus]|uniref:C2h2-type zn-finger protein n=1 Tax=Aedes albopictus TaxID=7160 RepID=A0ABM1XY73_AEDAL
MSDLDVENICRLCCEKKGRLRSLFERKPANHSLSLQQMILDVTRLEVEPGDKLPQKICRTCSKTLEKMYETIEGYRTNDLKLRQQLGQKYLAQVEIKEEEVDIDLLEKTCEQDMMVENICIKQEADEEQLDHENLDEGQNAVKLSKENQSDSESAEEANLDEDEWKPSKEDKEDEEKVIKRKKSTTKKSRRKRNPGDPPLKRIRYRDPNIPRFADFKCYVCMGESHGTAEALLTHLNSIHANLLPYTCTDCQTETVVFNTVLAMNTHKRQHMNPEKCPHCDRRYTTKNNVKLHIQMYHTGDNEPNPSPCDTCGKVCSSKLALKNHMRLHTSGSACEMCGKVFLERSKLQRHIQTKHEKLKKFECNICQKKLASISAVQNHIDRFHSSQVFTCSYCPKTFNLKLTHRAHEQKHIENKNYVATKDWKDYYTVLDGQEGKVTKLKKCNLCGFETSNMGPHLAKVHFPTEYRCEICDATFRNKQSYNIHVEEHEHGKAHRCPICGREFSERKNLITHLRTKKHQDHPLAQAMLSTIKTANTTPKRDKSTSEVDDDDTREETQIGVERGIGHYM